MNINFEKGNIVKYYYNVGRSITLYEPINEGENTLRDGKLKKTTFKVSSKEEYDKLISIMGNIDQVVMQIQKIEETKNGELCITYQKKDGTNVDYICENTPSNLEYYKHIKDKQEKNNKKKTAEKTVEKTSKKKQKHKFLSLFLAAAIALGGYSLGSHLASLSSKRQSNSKTNPITTEQKNNKPIPSIEDEIIIQNSKIETTEQPVVTSKPTVITTQQPTIMPTARPTEQPVVTSTPTIIPTQQPVVTPAIIPEVKLEESNTQSLLMFNKFKDSYYKIIPTEESRDVSEEDLKISYELLNSRYGIIRNTLNPDKEIKVVHIIDSYIFSAINQDNDDYLISNSIEDESRRAELRIIEDGLKNAIEGKGDTKVFSNTVNDLRTRGFFNNQDFESCVNGLRNLDINTFENDSEFEKYLGLVLNDNFFTMNDYLKISTLGATVGDSKIFNDNQQTMGSFSVLRNKSRQILAEIILMTPEEKGKIK